MKKLLLLVLACLTLSPSASAAPNASTNFELDQQSGQIALDVTSSGSSLATCDLYVRYNQQDDSNNQLLVGNYETISLTGTLDQVPSMDTVCRAELDLNALPRFVKYLHTKTIVQDDTQTGRVDDFVVDYHRISAPVVSNITLAGNVLSAKIRDDFYDIAACSFLVNQNSFSKTIEGSYNASTEKCSAALPLDVPTGDLEITASGTNSDNTVASANAVVHVNQLPTIENLVVNQETMLVTAGAKDLDGTVDMCQATFSAPGYLATIPGSYDAAAKVCRAAIPNNTPRTDDVLIELFVRDNVGGATTATTKLDKKPVVLPPGIPPVVIPPIVLPPGIPPVVVTPATPLESETILACSSKKLVITEIRYAQGKITIGGYALASKAGQTVLIQGSYLVKGKKKSVRSKTLVNVDGSWTKTFAASKGIRTSTGSFKALLAGTTSKSLKLTRYLQTEVLRAEKGGFYVKGRVIGKPGKTISIQTRQSCGKAKTVATLKLDSKGRFSGHVKTQGNLIVRMKAKTKSFYTYSIDRPVVV